MKDKWSIFRNPLTKYWTVRNTYDVYIFGSGALAHKAFNDGTAGR